MYKSMMLGMKAVMVARTIWNRARQKKRKIKKRLRLRGTNEERFTRIYQRNSWGSRESRSGTGSELSTTVNLRLQLPMLLKSYGVTRILDAPCGDFNWMQHLVPVLADLGVEYIGGDIVKEIAESNQQRFGAKGVSFLNMDITRDSLPAVDLMMVRDCLIHLSFRDIHRFVENFCQSEIKLLLTTTVLPDDGENHDILTGDWRPIHLFSHPFNFPNDPLERIRDWEPPHPPDLRREMCMFTRSHVLLAREAMTRSIAI